MAPLAHRTTRVSIMGTFAGGAEEWSTGFWFGYEDGDADLPDQALADGIRNAWQAFYTNAQSYFSSNFQCTVVKCSSVGTDGKSSAADTIYSTFPANVQGTSANHMPPQIALVATLQSATARGVGSKGRMYLPGPGIELAAGGKLNAGKVSLLADQLGVFLTAVNALPANNVILNASHGSLNPDGSVKIGGSAAVSKAVQTVKVGDVYDTQRRRRNGLSEVYISRPIN